MAKITINGTDFKVRNTLRAMFIFEEIAGKPFCIETLLDNYLYSYCILLACNPGCELNWNEYIDALDSRPELYAEMAKALEESARLMKDAAEGEEVEGDKKKD